MNRLDDYLEATFKREKAKNDPNTILKRKLLMKNRQIIKRFTDFVKESGRNACERLYKFKIEL